MRNKTEIIKDYFALVPPENVPKAKKLLIELLDCILDRMDEADKEYVVLNDDDTWASLDGCWLILSNRVYNLRKLIDIARARLNETEMNRCYMGEKKVIFQKLCMKYEDF